MSIIAKRPESTFIPAPEGLHLAVCVDVIDVGVVSTSYGDRHMVRVVWQIEDEHPHTHRRFEVRKQYNLSLHEKATLRKDLEAWRGRKFTDEELRGFDLEKLIGVGCQVQVVHSVSDDGSTTYANVTTVVAAPRNLPKIAPQDYVRAKDRAPRDGARATDDPDDPMPF